MPKVKRYNFKSFEQALEFANERGSREITEERMINSSQRPDDTIIYVVHVGRND